jgi:hypothetical protein
MRMKAQGSRHTAKGIGYKVDEIVKSHFNDWMPAFAGMTEIISI